MKNRIFIASIYFILSTAILSAAGRETYKWFFGIGAGLDFNSGVPVAINGAMDTEEGCATICDAFGNLLFYTNGVTVWNKNNQVMPNGKNLNGHFSSTQSSVIVKKPGSLVVYYVFTTLSEACDEDFIHGEYPLSYTVVDMNLDGGNGDIISGQKNIMLYDSTTEKLTAIKHDNGEDMWLVSHRWNSDEFVCYLITKDGVDINNPVISKTGLRHEYNDDALYDNCVGYMKASPGFTKIGLTIMKERVFEILDFDNKTGKLSNPVTFKSVDHMFTYGIEFSPDGTKLYSSEYLNNSESYIYQYDLEAGGADDIGSSGTRIAENKYQFAALQRALDDQIYISVKEQRFLAAIQEPDEAGPACSYKEKAVSLGSNFCNEGLPNFIPSDFEDEIRIEPEELLLCEGDSLYLECNKSLYDSVKYSWTGPGGFSAEGTSMSILNVDNSNEGEYKVYAQYLNGMVDSAVATVKVVVREVSFNKEYLDFNAVFLGGDDQEIIMTNDGDEEFEVISAEIKSGISVFSVESEDNLPNILYPGEEMKFTVNIEPDDFILFEDSLIISIAAPCPYRKAIYMSGKGTGIMSVWLPDTSVTPGEPNFGIPLYAKISDDEMPEINTTFSAEISFFADAMDISKKENPYVSYEINGDENIIKIEKMPVSIKTGINDIFRFSGLVLLGNYDLIPLKIIKFEIYNPNIDVDSTDGSLRLNDICIGDIRKIKSFVPTTMSISPSPAASWAEINISSCEKGAFILNIYDIQGQLIESYSWNRLEDSDKLKHLKLNLDNYRSGVYRAVLATPWYKLSKPLVIMK